MGTQSLPAFGLLLHEGNKKLQTQRGKKKRKEFFEELRQELKHPEKPAPAISTIYKWEEGSHPPPYETIWRFAELFAQEWGGRDDWDWFRELLLTSGYASSENVETLLETLLPNLPDNPYRGLAAFEIAHAELFFGRQTLIMDMLQALKQHRFLAVIGPSGSGKSSVVQAGLIPKLKEEAIQNNENWLPIVMQPRATPLRELATQLAALWPLKKQKSGQITTIRRHIEQGLDPFLDELAHVLQHNSASRLVLVVDQFEELWTLNQGDFSEQKQFLNLLLQGVEISETLIVILTIRADFLHRVMEHRTLAQAIQDHDLFITPMEADELTKAIVAPAKRLRGQFQDGLVDKLVQETLKRDGALPLLAFTLEQLWLRRTQTGNQALMTWQAFKVLGGVEGALAKQADYILETKYNSSTRQLIRQILLRLVHPTDDEIFDIRRRVYLRELVTPDLDIKSLQILLKHLVDARLLTAGQQSDPQTEMIELSHEALIRAWPTLNDWLQDNRVHIRQREQLEMEARLWQENGRPEGFLITGAKLAHNQNWLAESTLELNDLSQTFLQASEQYNQYLEEQKQADYQEKLRLERERRKLLEQKHKSDQETLQLEKGRRKLLVIVTIALALIALGAVGGAIWSYNQEQAMEQAHNRTTLAVVNQAIQIVNGNDLSRKKPALAIAILIEAFQVSQSLGDSHLAEQALRDALHITGGIGLAQHTKEVKQLGITADNQWLITGSSDQTAYLWDLEAPIPGTVVSPPFPYSGQSGHLAWSTHWLVTVSITNSVTIYDLRQPSPWEYGTVLKAINGEIKTLTITPNNRWLIVHSADNLLYRWDLTDSGLVDNPELVGSGVSAQSFLLTPDSQWLIVQSNQNRVLGWDLTAGRLSNQPTLQLTSPMPLQSMAVDSTGRWLVAHTVTHQLLRWDLHHASSDDLPLTLFAKPLKSFTISPNGQWVVASDQRKGAIYRADLTATSLISETLVSDTNPPYENLALSADGKWLAATHTDNRIFLWSLDNTTLNEPQILRGHDHNHSINQVIISPDSRWLISSSQDKTARIWPLTSHQPGRAAPFITTAHTRLDNDRLLMSNNNQLISVGADSIKMWDMGQPYPPQLQSQALSASAGQQRCHPVLSPKPKTHWLVTSDRTTISYWDLAEPNQPKQLSSTQPFNCAMALNQHNHLIATRPEGMIEQWDLGTGKQINRWTGHIGPIHKAVFNMEGNLLVTVGEDGLAKGWHFTSYTSSPAEKVLLEQKGTALLDVVIKDTLDARWLIILSENQATKQRQVLYQTLTDNQDEPFIMSTIETAHTLRLSSEKRYLYVGGDNGTGYVWDSKASVNKSTPRLYPAHENRVWGRFTSDSNALIQVGSWQSGQPKRWSLLKEDSLESITFKNMGVTSNEDQRTSIAISTADEWLVVGRQNGTIQIWPQSIDRLISLACYTAGRNLTKKEWQQYFGKQLKEATCRFSD